MQRTILVLLLLSPTLWTQSSFANKEEIDTIRRVKIFLTSSLDRNLPKVSLKFFLKYEGGGVPIKWILTSCNPQLRNKVVEDGGDSVRCVQADMSLKDGRAAMVLISVGTFKKSLADVPTMYGVTVTYPGGTIRRLDRLSDLPVELHRPLPKGPKDLPAPVRS